MNGVGYGPIYPAIRKMNNKNEEKKIRMPLAVYYVVF